MSRPLICTVISMQNYHIIPMRVSLVFTPSENKYLSDGAAMLNMKQYGHRSKNNQINYMQIR
jgi:hypothetical protein